MRSSRCTSAARPRPGRAYLQIVESRRDGDRVRQQVIATLGRFEELQASGQLERLLRSGARFAAKAMVLSAANDEAATTIAVRRRVRFKAMRSRFGLDDSAGGFGWRAWS